MGRGGDWPPNSFAEWMVGQNFRPRQLSPEEGQKPVLKLELSEDEASGEETLAVTYPGRRRRAGSAKQAVAGASGRKVRFDSDRKPLKSALKKSSSSSSDATLVDTSDEESSIYTEASSDIDTSEDEVPLRQRRSRSRKGKVGGCKKEDSDDSSAAKDALPHPTCTCDECVKGRKILKAVIKFEAKTKAAEKASDNPSKGKNKGKQQAKKNSANDTSDTEGDTTDADATEDDKKLSSKSKKTKKQKQKEKKESSPNQTKLSPVAELQPKVVNKKLFRLPEYPTEMKPNLIMRPEARVMQIEHAFETPYDPRPNAFYDNGKGITRVYHGPKYANPTGKLYAGYDNEKVTTPHMPAAFPPGAMPNPYTPWLASNAPGPMPPFGQNPAMYAQMADNEDAMRKAASQGLGLSGLPPPPVPPYFKEMQEEMAQQANWQKSGVDEGPKKGNFGWSTPNDGDAWRKAASEKGSKKGDATWGPTPGWGNEGDNTKSKPVVPEADPVVPVAPADPPPDQNNTGGWDKGGGGGATWGAFDSGSKKGSIKGGGATPIDFGGWGDSNQPQEPFKRSKFLAQHSRKALSDVSAASKDGGSQKQGSQKNWNAGGDNTWGANDNQNSSGWGEAKDQKTWGATGNDNGEQQPSPLATQVPPNTRASSIANGSPGNGGGGDWGNKANNGEGWGNGSTQAASATGGGWGKFENTATGWGSNKGASPQQLNNEHTGNWGGPPGSFPRSAHNSRPGSNAGMSGGDWGNSGHNDKDREFKPSVPEEHFKGAFDWPAGSGPSAGFNIGGGPGSRRGSTAGCHDPRMANFQYGVFSGSQRDGADPPAGGFSFHSNGGPSDWSNKPSDQATGPSNPPDWRNPDAAQNTGGKAMNW